MLPVRHVIISYFLFFSLLCYPTFAQTTNDSNTQNNTDVTKLELAGDDSFEYDVSNKIRKTKSGFSVGIGMNLSQHIRSHALQVNASIIFGYSYFFHKTFGLRGIGIFDNTQSHFYGGGGVDVIWDFIQTEPFGLGIFLGSSAGYEKRLLTGTTSGFLAQLHAGISMVFDSGRNRIEIAFRLPYNKLEVNDSLSQRITYIFMYSYTF